MARIKFSLPTLEELKSARKEAKQEIGENYSLRKASTRFFNRAIQEYNQSRRKRPVNMPISAEEDWKIALDQIRFDPVAVRSFNNYFQKTNDFLGRFSNQLRNGKAYLQFRAIHKEIEPTDLDIENMLDEIISVKPKSEFDSEREAIQFFQEELARYNDASNVDNYRPFETEVVPINLRLENPDIYSDFVKEVKQNVIDHVNLEIRGVKLNYPNRARTVEELHDYLTAKSRHPKRDINISLDLGFENRQEGFNVSLRNGYHADEPDDIIVETLDYPEKETAEAIDFLQSYISELEWIFAYDPSEPDFY